MVCHSLGGLVSRRRYTALDRLFVQLYESTARTTPGRATVADSRAFNAVLIAEVAPFPPQEHARAAREGHTLSIDGAVVFEGWILYASRRFAKEDAGDVGSKQACFQGIEKVPKVAHPGTACRLRCRCGHNLRAWFILHDA